MSYHFLPRRFSLLAFCGGRWGKKFFFPLVITKIISHSQMGSFNASRNKVQGSSRVQKGDWHLTLHLKKKKEKRKLTRVAGKKNPRNLSREKGNQRIRNFETISWITKTRGNVKIDRFHGWHHLRNISLKDERVFVFEKIYSNKKYNS